MGWEGLLSSWAWSVVGMGEQKEGWFHMIQLLILFPSLAFIICSLSMWSEILSLAGNTLLVPNFQ